MLGRSRDRIAVIVSFENALAGAVGLPSPDQGQSGVDPSD